MSKKPQPLVSLEDFFVNASLYAQFDANSDAGRREVVKLNQDFRFQCFCPKCGSVQPFLIAPKMTQLIAGYREAKLGYIPAPINPFHENGTLHPVQYYAFCQHNLEHRIKFWVEFNDWKVTKLGQHPPLADIALGELAPFLKVLDASDGSELTRAVGLYSHGIGIGSFVYLRRIFERLVNRTLGRSTIPNKPTAEAFRGMRLDEKVKAIALDLPPFLTNNSTPIYSLLSVGIHGLEEDECLTMFPLLKQAIVMILEEDLAKRQRKQREEEVARLLGDKHSAIKNAGKVSNGDKSEG